MSTVIDYGHFALGSAPTWTWVFEQEIAGTWTPATPGVSPVLNVTQNGVKTNRSAELVPGSAGTYTWTPLLTVAGYYSATIYAPAGSGEASQPFIFAVDADPNYP